VVLTADNQTLPGDMIADSISTIAVTLKNNSTLTGKLTKASITLDAASLWSVTGNSVLTSLPIPPGSPAPPSPTSRARLHGSLTMPASPLTVTWAARLIPWPVADAGAGRHDRDHRSGHRRGSVLNAPAEWPASRPRLDLHLRHKSLHRCRRRHHDGGSGRRIPAHTLGGTSVTIDGKAAYLNYVSPSQLNVQAPNFSTTGNVTVTVTNSSGSSSASVPMQAVMPGLFTSSDYCWPCGPAMASSSTATAHRSPAIPPRLPPEGRRAGNLRHRTRRHHHRRAPGLVWAGAYATTDTPTVAIGDKTAALLYSGLIGAGLYQINLTVPPDSRQAPIR